jgi:lysophospholipase L1-like esterase
MTDSASGHVRRWQNVALSALDVLWLISFLVIALAWILDPFKLRAGPLHLTVSWGWKPIVVCLTILIIRFLVRRRPARGLWETGFFKKSVMALASVYFVFGAIELALSAVGYEAVLPPIVVEGEDHRTQRDKGVMEDPEVLWRFVPGSTWRKQTINSIGYRDREVERIKPPNTIRVIAMGDSCTAQGNPTYVQALHQMLTDKPLTRQTWEAFGMAVFGYSSMQGLKIFEKETRHLSPDIVTLYFGWNDHWTFEKPDRLRLAVAMDPASARLFETLRKKRFFEFMASSLRSHHVKGQPEYNHLRVPPADYRATLKEFVRDIRAAGAAPLLITAPRRNLQESVVRSRHARSVAEAEALHDQYVEITREVARETGAPLLDLAEIFKGPECDAYFSGDGIHFEQDGLDRIAAELYQALQAIVPTLHAGS